MPMFIKGIITSPECNEANSLVPQNVLKFSVQGGPDGIALISPSS